MPDQKPDPEAALRKLGQHIRDGWSKQHPISEKSLETVRDTVRELWEKEQQAERENTARRTTGRTPERPKDGPDMGD